MTVRLLDANVFIEAKNRYYGFDLVPAFWSWIEQQATSGEIASTDMVYDELEDGGDDLAQWVKARRELIFHVPSSSAGVAAAVGVSARGSSPRTTRRTSSTTSWTAPIPSWSRRPTRQGRSW